MNRIIFVIFSYFVARIEIIAFEESIHVSHDTFLKIIKKLNAAEVFDCSYDSKENTKTPLLIVLDTQATPEICEWGKAATFIAPHNNPCNIVAVQLYLSKSKLVDSFYSISKNFTPYSQCTKMTVKRTIVKNISKRVVYCPSTIIRISSTRDTIINKFLIGEGDHHNNSVFVYSFNLDRGNSMDVIYYMKNILNINLLIIKSGEYSTRASNNDIIDLKMHGREKAIRKFEDYRFTNNIVSRIRKNGNSEFCQASVSIVQNTCKDFASKKFRNSDEAARRNEFYVDYFVDIENRFYDTSGLVPYKCVARPVSDYTTILKYPLTVNMIYCPRQLLIFDDDDVYTMPGFLYSAGDSNKNSVFLYEPYFETDEDGITKLLSIDLIDFITWGSDEDKDVSLYTFYLGKLCTCNKVLNEIFCKLLTSVDLFE